MRRLRAAAVDFSDDRRGEALLGDWTAREIRVHIASWDREPVSALDQLLAGRRPAFLEAEG